MHERSLAEYNMLRVLKYQTYQMTPHAFEFILLKASAPLYPPPFRTAKKSRLMGIRSLLHVLAVTAISFFHAHGISALWPAPTRPYFFPACKSRPKFQRKIGGSIYFISQFADQGEPA